MVLRDLPGDWSGQVSIIGIDDAGNRVEIQNYVAVPADGIVPPFEVEPLNSTIVMISIPTVDVSSVRFTAFVVPFGDDPAPCEFDSDADNELEVAGVVEDHFTRAELDARNYRREYVERHAAAFVVPEASTISLCAGWVDAHGWSSSIPDHVYSQVVHSPDRILPVVTVDEALLHHSRRPNGDDPATIASWVGTQITSLPAWPTCGSKSLAGWACAMTWPPIATSARQARQDGA